MVCMDELGARTSISAYYTDRAWLQQRQREISAARSSWVTMADLVHELIMAIVRAEEGA